MGLATAKLLASKGAIISLSDIDAGALDKAIKLLEHSEKHLTTTVDVRDGSAVATWIDNTVAKYGKLDGAVNMAGIITHATPLVDTTDDSWSRTFDINVNGVFNCLRAQLRAMGNGGSIVGGTSGSNAWHSTNCYGKGVSSKCFRTVRCSWKLGLLCQ